MAEDVEIVEGRVARVLFANPDNGFAVIEIENDEGARIAAAGAVGLVAVDDELRLSGRFDEHPRFGWRLVVDTAQPISPKTLIGIERYLSGPRVEGIGPELARRLVAAFGSATLEILDEHPERLTEVPGIGARRAEQIARSWTVERSRRELLIFLRGHGLGQAASNRVLATFGEGALAEIRRDPFVLVRRVPGIGFRTADRIALSQGVATDAPSRLEAGLVHELDGALLEGHTCLPGEALLERARRLLAVDDAPLRQVLRELVERERIVIARPGSRPQARYAVWPAFSFAMEREAAGRLRALATADDPLTMRLPRVLGPDFAPELSDEQIAAIETLLGAKVAVLTGGPGVGKTTVLKTLVGLWRDRRLKIALASPTGRAAKRLEEVVGLEACTVHRLLRWDVGKKGFSHDENEPLEAQVVVIDEASMLDLPLFLSLLRALPAHARLLLVGDADQLPSVGPGSVLGDVIGSGVVPVARLTRIYRQAEGSAIVELAHRILAGAADPARIEDDADVVFLRRPDPEDGARLAVELLLREIPRRHGIAGGDAIQILTPMHRGAVGTIELNRAVQRARRPDDAELVSGDAAFRRDDKVMQVRNDYDRELYNGDIGWVVEIDPENGRLVARFDGREHVYQRDELGDLKPAWAISVHKSQGGEYPAVILPLYGEHRMLLQRQVLYTAVTRARRLLFLIGEPSAFQRAVRDDRMRTRHGALGDWLAGDEAEIWTPRAAD